MRGLRSGLIALILALPLGAAAQVALPQPASGAGVAPAPDDASGAGADPARLADLRARLTAAKTEMQSLRDQLREGGPAGYAALGGPDKAIDRMNRVEQELARLTSETEQMTNRLNRAIAREQTRLDDLEFRICEMEPACDLGALTGPSAAAPGQVSRGTVGKPAEPAAATAEEQADFDRARAALDAGDAGAAQQFATFLADHPASPLAVQAMILEGQALEKAGDRIGAARAWLTAFAAQPNGAQAPDALWGVADALASAGTTPERACHFLAELGARFPDTPQAALAAERSAKLGCAVIEGATLPEQGSAADGSGLVSIPMGEVAPLPLSPDDPEAAADEAAGLTAAQ